MKKLLIARIPSTKKARILAHALTFVDFFIYFTCPVYADMVNKLCLQSETMGEKGLSALRGLGKT